MSRESSRIDAPRSKAPNIRDVARLAGVSYQTVSRVLNNSDAIKPATRQRVLDVIDEVGYRPNQAARALVTSRSRTIGVLTTPTAHYGPTTSLRAIEDAARHAGYIVTTTSLAASDDDAIAASLEHLIAQAIEGLIVISPQTRVFDAVTRLQLSVPLVTLDSSGRDALRSPSVDQMTGARIATRHLIRLGHRDILHVAGPQNWIDAEARMAGFLAEISDADLPTLPPVLGDWTADSGYRIGRELTRFPDFTAVFAANDQMALGLLHAFRDAGLDVPRDVSVVGFDDIPDAGHFWPPLTTVRQDFAELGRRSIRLLLDQLGTDSERDLAPILPELIERGSTGPRSC